jgi:hypothetical protein
MHGKRFGALIALVVGASCQRAAVPAHPVTRAVAPYEQKNIGPAIVQAWELDLAGQRDQARPILERVVATLAAKRQVGLGATNRGTLVAGGKFVVVSSPAGVMLICDVATGKVVGTAEHGVNVAPIKGTSLFVSSEATADLVIREAPSGKVLQRFEHTSGHAASDDGSVLVVSVPDAVVAYDLRTQKLTQRIALASGATAVDLILGDHATAVTAVMSGESVGITYELRTGEEIVRQPWHFDSGPPAFSPDGKTIALAGNAPRDERSDVVRLVDRATKKTIASSRACDYPTGFAFSPDGKYLAVGRLRQVCIFKVTGLRLLAKTPELRPGWRGGDDLQNTDVRVIDDLVFAETADGTVGVFTLPGAKKLFVGRGEVFRMGGKPVVAVEEPPELVSIAHGGSISRRVMTDEERERPWSVDDDADDVSDAVFARIDPYVCRIGDRLLPRLACD